MSESPNVVSVRLPADLQIDASDFRGISAVHPDTFDGSSYIIDFLNPRDARRYKQLAEEKLNVKSQRICTAAAFEVEGLFPPGLEVPAQEILPPPGLEQMPALKEKVTRSEAKNNKQQKQGHEVRIMGLPVPLLKNAMISTIMEQAGLDAHVVSIDVKAQTKHGVASIVFSSETAAAECVNHCHGQKWNPSGPPVTASIVPRPQGKSSRSPRKAHAQGLATVQQKPRKISSSGLRSDAPAYVHTALIKDDYDKKMTTNSDASTTVSDSDGEVEQRKNSKSSVAWRIAM